jgi:hypothetical protein
MLASLTFLRLAGKGRYQEISAAKSVITPIDPSGGKAKLGFKRARLENLAFFPEYFGRQAGWTKEAL